MKLIKKSAVVLMTILVAVMAFASKSSATTKEELKEYMCSGEAFTGTELVIRDVDKAKLEKFFKENDMTEEQATKIKGIIDKAVAYMNADGAKSPNQMSTREKKKILFGYAKEAASILGLTVTYDASEERLDIYRDGKFLDSLNWGVEVKDGVGTTEPGLIQTGTTNYAYVAIVAVMLIASITLIVARKNAAKVNA